MWAADSQAYKTEIGYLQLIDEYEGTLPTGAGVLVSMVEANASTSSTTHLFLPDSSSEFLAGQTITNGSSVSSPGVSDHATNMARNFFGSTRSVAFGVTQVTVYEADHYLNSILNLTPANAGPPDVPTYKVQNHSWVGSFDSSSNNLETLRRLDYLIDTYDTIVPVGLNNASQSDYTELMAQSYNAIAVGRSDAGHIGGPTPFSSYGPGRLKPDIVSSPTATSAATASVSSVATMLYQSATDTANFANADADAARSETMKAILMAGATKEEFPTWENASPTQPLDLVYGAGELNVRNSFFIQQGGQFDGAASAGGTVADDYGWDYGEVNSGQSLFYDLSVPDFHSDGVLSVVLAWNVEITDTNSGSQFSPTQSLANLDLKLWDSTGAPLDAVLATSVSTKDNVEHVYLTGLDAGDYTIEVLSTSGDRDFGLAWRLDYEAPYRVTGDYNEDGVVDAADFTLWRDTVGSTSNLAADGDLNGVVDQGDYDLWRTAYGSLHTPPGAVSATLAAVPEPATLTMLAGAAMILGRRRRR